MLINFPDVNLVRILQIIDWALLYLFVCSIIAYKIFLKKMSKNRIDKLYLKQLQLYRSAWIEKYAMGKEPIVVIHSLRNNIMISSFLASTAIILVIGCLNLLFSTNLSLSTSQMLFIPHDIFLTKLKILFLILTLSYSFFHFMWYIRELHHMSLILNIPENRLKEVLPVDPGISNKRLKGDIRVDPVIFLSTMFLYSGIHFSLGIRGYYALIPLFLWLFHPILMIVSLIGIAFFLVRRDLGKTKTIKAMGS